MGNRKKASSTGTPHPTTTSEEQELHAAARTGDMNAVIRICSTNPLAVNSRDKHSRNPLHLAAWSGHAQVVNYLCKNKADAGAAAMDDMGAIHFAAQKGHLEVVKILVSSGVSVKSCNRKGMTALHYAAQGSHLELVKYLIKKGATSCAKNKAGKTPLDLASSEETRTLLAECKASSSEVVSDNKEKLEDDPDSTSKEKAVVGQHGGAANGREELTKRKASEDEVKENVPETKKSKVSLKHLIAADDTQEEEEED